jgi:Dolichyl-phosphate-mannose-protein mannosyltransferase
MTDSKPALASSPLLLFPAVALAVHTSVLLGYGWFRDELYYIACARRLAWGYVDQPPLSLAVLRPVLGLFGDSLVAVRLAAAVVAALTVLLVGLLAREMGGGRRAQALAMLAAVVAPEYLSLGHFYSMNVFDLAAWAVAALILLRVLRAVDRPASRARAGWAWLGLALGLGLLNKISVLWLGAGLAVGLLLTPYRRTLRTRGPWLAGAIAAVVFAPHVVWQIVHGWPTLAFIRRASQDKMVAVSVGHFAALQIEMLGPAVVVAVAGLVSVFRRADDRRLRVLGWAWVTVFAILALNGTSRPVYLAASCTWLFAAGGVAIDRWAVRRSAAWPWALATAMVALGAVMAPLALPVLPVDRYIAYANALGVAPSTDERHELGALPQFFADMQGWNAIVSAVDSAWRQLPPAERAHAVFFANNYGDAGAQEVLGRDRPPAFSGHNNYWFWGPPDDSVDAVIVITQDPARLRTFFTHVALAGQTDCGYCMPYENHQAVYIAWGRRGSWTAAWPGLRHFD